MDQSNFNEAQRNAIGHYLGPMRVLAGPGSGKTTVIIERIKSLIENQGVIDRNILVLTFSKATTREMDKRFNESTDHYSVSFNTFHSLFYKIVRSCTDLTIDSLINDEHKKYLLMDICKKNSIYIEDEDSLKNTINEISYVKNQLIDPDHYVSKCISTESFRQLYSLYEIYKQEKGKIDFDDMLCKCYNFLVSNSNLLAFWQGQFEFILVDEFQDINKVQYEVLKLLSMRTNNIFVVGDDDQSIYSFRGAKPEYLINFHLDFKNTKDVILNTNYRSTDIIIKLSNLLIGENKVRISKNMIGTNRKGQMPKLLNLQDSKTEANYISDRIIGIRDEYPLEEIAILFRTNMSARAYIDSLMERNIPFQLKDIGSSIFEHPVSRDLIAYLKGAIDYKCDEINRVINKPNRYISKNLISKYKEKNLIENILKGNELEEWQKARIYDLKSALIKMGKSTPYKAIKYIGSNLNYRDYLIDYGKFRKVNPKTYFDVYSEFLESSESFQSIEEFLLHIDAVILETKEKNKRDAKAEGVVLSTFHGAKGLEFENVFITGANEGIIPYEKACEKYEIEEERRLFYVGVTRAKTNLYISVLKYRHEEKLTRTRFLNCLK